MKFGRILGLLAIIMLAAPFAHADGTVNMLFTGVNGANNGTYYVSPYYGVMNYGSPNAQSVQLFCDDVNNEVHSGQTWTANVTNLGVAIAAGNNSGFAATRYGGTAGSPVTNPVLAYEEAAWLVSQFANASPSQYVDLQYALWDVMSYPTNPQSGPYYNSVVGVLLGEAAAGASTINPNNFEIITNVNATFSGPTQVQEFIIQTPEPGTLVLMICGVLTLALLTLFRARVAA